MFKALVLVCSIDLAPQDCQASNAIDVIQGPEASNEVTCGFYGQSYIAGTALAPTDGNYLKVQCIPFSSSAAVIPAKSLSR